MYTGSPIGIKHCLSKSPQKQVEPHINSTQPKSMQHSNLTSIRSRVSDPLIGNVVSFLTKSSPQMSDNEEEDDDMLLSNLEAEFNQLTSIWECDALNVVVETDNAGKTTTGWTCAYCPHPRSIGGPVFWETVNATKALAHVMKLPETIWLFARVTFHLPSRDNTKNFTIGHYY